MPRLRGTGKGVADRFTVRLDAEIAAYYRTKSNENGISISEYLRQTLVQGVIAENVQEIERRLQQLISKINGNSNSPASIPDNIALSILTSEEMLRAIIEQRDIQQLYAAQDRAKARLKRDQES